jgi:murein DD-endopeptidase MepM/ murein hydrolase activator NlpD
MGLLVRIAVVVLAAVAVGAASAKPPARIIFPLIGPGVFTDDFGDGRSQGAHEGNDILAARRAPAVAAEAGTVRFWTTSAQAGCMLYLYGVSGTTYHYIHLNNDRGTGNDNRGSCVPGIAYAPALKDGQAVVAGELIGFVGDSGDADGLHPHLHFELHPGGGDAVSPYRWLRKAQHLTAPA